MVRRRTINCWVLSLHGKAHFQFDARAGCCFVRCKEHRVERERECCCEERQPLAMWVFPHVFGSLTPNFMHCCFIVHRVERERECCCEKRQPLAMWVFPHVFGSLTPNFMHCCFTVHRIFQEHNTRRQLLAVISLDTQNFSTNCPFGYEGPAENVLPLYCPSYEENSNPLVCRINGYHKQQNEKR